jgi:hypothetical protein
MLDEIDDLMYQWKEGFITREICEEKILNAVLAYETARKEREAPRELCVVCKVEPVCPEQGFDTCRVCAAQIKFKAGATLTREY